MVKGRYAAAALAATAVALTVGATPAHADFALEGTIAGSGNAAISLKLYDTWYENPGGQLPDVRLGSKVEIGTAVQTSATDCRVTVYAELDKAGSNIWKTPKVTRGCRTALTDRGEWFANEHSFGPTSATSLNVHGCVDLYYNSSTSGWQRCMVTGWHDWNE